MGLGHVAWGNRFGKVGSDENRGGGKHDARWPSAGGNPRQAVVSLAFGPPPLGVVLSLVGSGWLGKRRWLAAPGGGEVPSALRGKKFPGGQKCTPQECCERCSVPELPLRLSKKTVSSQVSEDRGRMQDPKVEFCADTKNTKDDVLHKAVKNDGKVLDLGDGFQRNYSTDKQKSSNNRKELGRQEQRLETGPYENGGVSTEGGERFAGGMP